MLSINWILNFFELLAFLVGVAHWHKLQYPCLKIFIGLLGFIFIAEMIGKFLHAYNYTFLNTYWYSYFVSPIIFIGLYAIYAKHLAKPLLFILPIVLLCITMGIDFFTEHKSSNSYNSLSYTVNNITLIVIIFYYFIHLLQSNTILTFKKEPFFWISIGCLLYYLPTFPFYFFINTLRSSNVHIYYNYWYFTMVLNCLMYVCFTISFIWNKNN